MPNNKVTVGTYLDTHPKKNGLYPVKLRVTYQRSKKYYPLNIDLSREDFEQVTSAKPKGGLKDVRQVLDAYVGKGVEIVNTLALFSFEKFDEIWYGKNKRALNKPNVFVFFEDRIKTLREEQRENTAVTYSNTLAALKAFRNSLTFEEINVLFLNEFERFMIQRGNSMTTIGIYMRTFQAIINLAISERFFKQEDYPFGKKVRGYVTPKGTGTKDFLTQEEFNTLRNFQSEIEQEEKARDFFVFSCLANGLNFKDICLLKYGNIKGNTLLVVREKTKRATRGKPMVIRIILTEPIWEIINKWGSKSQLPDEYIFNIIDKNLNEIEQAKKVKQYIKTTNKYLDRIKEKLKLNVNLTTMVARHTFATMLLRMGASKEFIQESFQHTSILTTENYTKGFADTEREKWANALIN